MKDIKILIATHKQYFVPNDSVYFPLHVGKDSNHNETEFQPDNTGDNISSKNPKFCELTGLYWAWKNLKADYIGLVHYRRYFKLDKSICRSEEKKFQHVLTTKQVEGLLEKADIILPKKRRYFINLTQCIDNIRIPIMWTTIIKHKINIIFLYFLFLLSVILSF